MPTVSLPMSLYPRRCMVGRKQDRTLGVADSLLGPIDVADDLDHRYPCLRRHPGPPLSVCGFEPYPVGRTVFDRVGGAIMVGGR